MRPVYTLSVEKHPNRIGGRMNIRVCQECELEFNPQHPEHRGGYINVCGDCGEEDVVRHVGFTASTGKSDYNTEIIANPTVAQVGFIKRQMRSGPSQCSTSLGVSSNGSAVNSQKEKRSNEK